jgi:hypothetical protein
VPQELLAVLSSPPEIVEYEPDAVLSSPPPTKAGDV